MFRSILLGFPAVVLSVGLACATFLYSTLPAGTAPAQNDLKWPSSGHITYKVTSKGRSGTGRFIWMNGGAQMRQEEQMQVRSQSGKTQTISSWSIYDGFSLYTYHPKSKHVIGAIMPLQKARDRMLGALSASGGDGKVIGKGQVLGHTCEIRQATTKGQLAQVTKKIWMWKNLLLRYEILVQMKKSESSKQPMNSRQSFRTTLVATSLQTGVKLSSSLFSLPKGSRVDHVGIHRDPVYSRRMR